MYEHHPVLFEPALDALAISPEGLYVDGTYGRGGHSGGILERLGMNGELLAFDRDPQAVTDARARYGTDSRFRIVHACYSEFTDHLPRSADGILLDLGVSSPQLDDADRGFSFMNDGPLDMRMNPEAGISAAQWLARAKQDEIANVLYDYGDEKFRGRIARTIVEARRKTPIRTTAELAAIISSAVPRREPGKHPATRSFQAIRIHVNDELGELRRGLSAALSALRVGGRLAVISFHSLEDRIVKRFIRDHQSPPDPFLGEALDRPVLKRVGKPVFPSEADIQQNVRARSSVLRIAERCA